ncbi:MAG TPA: hypothetical protein VF627_09295 [Abditibacterium sp.]
MPASIPTDPPTPTPKPRVRGAVNKDFSDGLQKTQRVIDAAQNPQYAPALQDGDISAAFVTQLEADTLSAREFLAQAVSSRGARKDATVQESAERLNLTRMLQTAQTRALQKFHDSNPDRPRDTYYVGTSLGNAADALLTQIASAIIGALPADALPGIKPQFLTDLGAAFAAWQESISAQSAQGGQAIQNLAQFEALFKSIEARRRTIQFAADADFPFFDPLHKVAREAFQLPVKTPFR